MVTTAPTPKPNPLPWAVVTDPGTDDERVDSEHGTYTDALTAMRKHGGDADVMRRLDDGTLTTEY